MHRLRLLLVLAEELHFGRAARRMFISQPAFSRQIRALEEHLGVSLVERSTRRVELTAAGEALLPRVRAVVEAADSLRHAAEVEAHSLSGRLVLGSYITALPVIRLVVERMREHHPRLEIELREIDFVEQAGVLLEGHADAVLCYEPMPAGIQTLPLAAEPQVVCLPESHPLADRNTLTLAELADVPVIGLSERVPRQWRDFWAADPRPGGTPVRYTDHGAATFESSIAAVSLGHGMRFVSASCRVLFPRPGIRYVDVVDLPPCSAVLAWSATHRDSPAVAALRRVVHRLASAAGAQGAQAAHACWWDVRNG
ncbi:LysR family transcriptional regulator [Streptomyces sp. NPDC049627]|uniref:LysR family transcriptional regulator n=1 Tax=Streptomyces sp. NPDC049627 TaxID=3365595 RepID=UPI00378EDC59